MVAPEARAKSYGMIGAAFGLGFTIGPVIGGWLGEIDLRMPFWFAAGLALVNFCYGLFVLPESLPPQSRATRFDWRAIRPYAAILRSGAIPGSSAWRRWYHRQPRPLRVRSVCCSPTCASAGSVTVGWVLLF